MRFVLVILVAVLLGLSAYGWISVGVPFMQKYEKYHHRFIK